MTDNNEIEKRLWEAADQLRANSGLKYSQFSRPLLGLIFLKYADYKFTQVQKVLEKVSKRASEKGTMDAYIPRRKKISPRDYQAKGVIYLPEKARYSYLLDLPESENIGKVLNEAMATVENEVTKRLITCHTEHPFLRGWGLCRHHTRCSFPRWNSGGRL